MRAPFSTVITVSGLALALVFQQPVTLRDANNNAVPVSQTSEFAHDEAMGTLTNVKSVPMECRARTTPGSAVSADDDAALVNCDRTGTLAVNVLSVAGAVLTVPGAGQNNGALNVNVVAAASNNATNYRASQGQIYTLTVTNMAAAVRNFRLFNLSGTPTCTSTTGMYLYLPLKASETVAISYPVGMAFDTGIGYCITGLAGTTDNTSVTAGDVVVNFTVK